jgi:tRNA nucleotidyltransferase/poly(A) polymerase
MNIAEFESLLVERFKLRELLELFDAAAEPVLAGGAVRDYLLGRPLKDLDFSTRSDPTAAAQEFARRQHGRWFWLDRKRLQSRVLLGSGAEQLSYDFTPWRAPRLGEDLRLRDFTLNALAVAFSPDGRLQLVDPLGGLEHLQRRELRLCAERALGDDPLRVLRGIRFVAQLGLAVPEPTRDALMDAAAQLDRSAGERIAEELRLLFEADPGHDALELLAQTGIFALLTGVVLQQEHLTQAAAGYRTWDRQLTELAAVFPDWAARFRQPVTGCHQLLGLLKFSLLLVAAEVPESGVATLLERLKLGRRCAELIRRLQRQLLAEEPWVDRWPDQTRARLRRLEALQPDGEALLLARWLANRRNPQEIEAIDALLTQFRSHSELGRLQVLVTGEEIIELLKLQPGQQVGILQAALRKQELAGLIDSREEALDFLLRQRDKEIDKGGG